MTEIGVRAGWQTEEEEWYASVADGSETSIGHCVTDRVEIQGDEIEQKFLVIDTHHMLRGMNILKRLNLQMYLNGKLLSAKLDSNKPDICAVSPPIGLQELTPAEKQKLAELIDRQKQRFELVEEGDRADQARDPAQGHYTANRGIDRETQRCKPSSTPR